MAVVQLTGGARPACSTAERGHRGWGGMLQVAEGPGLLTLGQVRADYPGSPAWWHPTPATRPRCATPPPPPGFDAPPHSHPQASMRFAMTIRDATQARRLHQARLRAAEALEASERCKIQVGAGMTGGVWRFNDECRRGCCPGA